MPDYPTAALPPIDAEPPYPQEPPPRHRRARLIALIAGVAVLVIGLPLGLMLRLAEFALEFQCGDLGHEAFSIDDLCIIRIIRIIRRTSRCRAGSVK